MSSIYPTLESKYPLPDNPPPPYAAPYIEASNLSHGHCQPGYNSELTTHSQNIHATNYHTPQILQNSVEYELRPTFKLDLCACNFSSCVVSFLCYPLVWAKTTNRVTSCANCSRLFWIIITGVLVYSSYLAVTIYTITSGILWMKNTNTTHAHGLGGLVVVLFLFFTLIMIGVFILCKSPTCIMTYILSRKVKQEARIQKSRLSDCFRAVFCDTCVVRQMFYEVNDEVPSCGNIWTA